MLIVSLSIFICSALREKTLGTIYAVVFSVIPTSIAALVFLPVSSRDALIHHLAVPKWWLEQGGLIAIPWHEWSYYPMMLQTGFLLMLPWAEWGAAALHFSLYISLAALVLSSSRKMGIKNSYALFAAALSILLPMNIRLSAEPLVDLLLANLSLLFLTYLCEFSKRGKSHLLLLAAIAAGLLFGTKYNAHLFLASCLISSPLLFMRAKKRAPLMALLISVLLVLAVASPWLLRNFSLTGNPVYPLYDSVFNTQKEVTPGPASLSSIEKRMALYGEGPLDFALLPVRMFTSGQDNSPQYFDGVLSPLLLLSLLSLLAGKRYRWIPFFFFSTFLYFYLVNIFSSGRIRYLAPLFGPLCILSAVTLEKLLRAKKVRNYEHRIVGALLVIQILLSLSYVLSLYSNPKKPVLQFLKSEISGEEYLSKTVPDYLLADWANKNLLKSDRIQLVLTPNSFYYYEVPVVSAGYFSAAPLIEALVGAENTQDVTRYFSERYVSHIALTNALTNQYLTANLTPNQAVLWNTFQKEALELQTVIGPFSVWKIDTGVSPKSNEESSTSEVTE